MSHRHWGLFDTHRVNHFGEALSSYLRSSPQAATWSSRRCIPSDRSLHKTAEWTQRVSVTKLGHENRSRKWRKVWARPTWQPSAARRNVRMVGDTGAAPVIIILTRPPRLSCNQTTEACKPHSENWGDAKTWLLYLCRIFRCFHVTWVFLFLTIFYLYFLDLFTISELPTRVSKTQILLKMLLLEVEIFWRVLLRSSIKSRGYLRGRLF